MSAADLAFVAERDGAIVGGAVAAQRFGELLRGDRAEANVYVAASLHGELGSMVAAVPDQLGGVILRVVPDEVWPYVESLGVGSDGHGRRLAPRAAVALDLMESGDPRYWVAAEHLIETRG